ncbi:hypothetical protein KKD60_00875, partial [Patescibacteria group bacterium]|nr:hypothetical protein [Patescibacteria group bacterium]
IYEEIKKVEDELEMAKKFLNKTEDAKLIKNINRMIEVRTDRLEVLRGKVYGSEVVEIESVEKLKKRFAEVETIEDEKIKRQELIKLLHDAFDFGDDDLVNQIEDELGIPKAVRMNKIRPVEGEANTASELKRDGENEHTVTEKLKKLRWRVPNKNNSGDKWKEKMRYIRVLKKKIGEISEDFPNKEKREELVGRLVYLSQRVYKQEDPTEKSKAYYILGKKYYEEHVPKSGVFILINEWHNLLAEKEAYENKDETSEVGDIKIAEDGIATDDETEIKSAELVGEEAIIDDGKNILVSPEDEVANVEFFAQLPIAEVNQVGEVIEEIEKLPPADKKTLFEGMADIGFKTSEVTNKVMKNFIKQLGDNKLVKKDSLLGNFFLKYSDIYQKKEKSAKKMQEIVGKGGLSKLSGVGQGFGGTVGTMLKLGRILYDVTGASVANPFKYVTMAGMTAGNSLAAMKEVRFDNEKVFGKRGLVKDEKRAYEEAWKIHEKAKNNIGDRELTKEDLVDAYSKLLPEDIKNRLGRYNVETGLIKKMLGANMENGHIESHINKLNQKISEIEGDKKLTTTDQKNKIDKLLSRNADFLQDLDKIVSDAGMVDNIAFWLRMGEKTSKTMANLMMIDSVARLASASMDWLHLTNKFPEFFGHEAVHAPVGPVVKKAVELHGQFSTGSVVKPSVGPVSPGFIAETNSGSVAEVASAQNIEIKIGGNVNTFSGAINEAVKNADSAVKDNFIHQVLGDDVAVSGDSRQDLLHKAVAKLSIGEVYNGKEVPDLIHDGNKVVLFHNGSWEVQKGDGVFEAKVVAPIEVVQHSSMSETDKIAFDDLKDSINGRGSEEKLIDDTELARLNEVYRKTQLEIFHNHGVSDKLMQEIGINPADPNLLDNQRAMERMGFLASYSDDNDPSNFSKAEDVLKLVKDVDISPRDAFNYYDNIKSFKGDEEKIKAVVDLMKGGNVEKALFNLTGVKVTEENFEIKDGVFRVRDYYKKGFDFVMTKSKGEIKIGIDGPSRFNWKARGWWGNLRPDETLTAENLTLAKEEVEKMSKQLEDQRPKY